MKSELFFVKSGRKREWNMDEFRIIVCMKKEVIFQFPVSTTPWKRDKRQAVISGAEEGMKYSTAILGWGCRILSFTAFPSQTSTPQLPPLFPPAPRRNHGSGEGGEVPTQSPLAQAPALHPCQAPEVSEHGFTVCWTLRVGALGDGGRWAIPPPGTGADLSRRL